MVAYTNERIKYINVPKRVCPLTRRTLNILANQLEALFMDSQTD